ncbi:Sca4 family protein [Candidatus Tisiphia endosymbiont of Oplodontha viridula]|uniref:Sca4 family protein n=1 Tax=Candidatus Tisiphia endosymbiont of Oplodontha viridula TaxID=3077925 RepID=UPI0035C89CFF
MSKDRNSREYFEYYEDFKDKIKGVRDALKGAGTVYLDETAQSLLEIVKGTLKDSAVSFDAKKNILEGFAEIIRNNTEEQNELPESDKIEVQSEVFDKFAEKLAESIQNGTISENWQKYVEQLQEIVTATKPQERTQDIFCLPGEEKTPIELDNSSIDIPSFSVDDLNVDPITQAIRTQILTKQREIIAEALVTNNIAKPEELDDLNKFRTYFKNEQNKEKVSEFLKKDENLKHTLEQVEISGYKSVHTQFAGRFSTMEWQDGVAQNAGGIKQQIVRDANGREIATLIETTHQINPPHTVQKSDGTNVTIRNYRTIDFPITLENKNGPMHLSLAVKDQNGRNIAASNAVYFTAHYDDNGKLVEVSSPHPVKFTGNSPDAIGYIEHGGQIYTLPVTQAKYKAMMQEVAKNLEHGVDISPSIESAEAPDFTVTSRQKIEEQQSHKVQETMMPTDIKKEEVASKVDIPAYPKEQQVIREERIESVAKSQTMSRNSDFSPVVVDQVENIKANLLKLRQPSIPARKNDEDIAKLAGILSKNLLGKDTEEQKNHIDKELKNLSTPQQIKLLQELAKTIAEKRGEELKRIDVGERKADVDPVRLITENREVGKDGLAKIGQKQRRAEHANIKDDVKLQALIHDKINAISKKTTVAPKIKSAGSFQSM